WQKMMAVADVDVIVNIVGGIGFIVLAVLAWPRLRLSYRVYTIVIVVVSFAYQTGSIHPYMGLLRHLLLAFQVFLGFGKRSYKSVVCALGLGLGVLGQYFLLSLYGLEAWVP